MQERIDRGRVGRLTWLVTWLVGGLAASALLGGSLVFLLPAPAAAETLPLLFSIPAGGWRRRIATSPPSRIRSNVARRRPSRSRLSRRKRRPPPPCRRRTASSARGSGPSF